MSEKPLDDLDESDLNSWLKDWPNDDGTAKSPDDLRAEPYPGTDRISDENQTEPATKPQFVPVPFEPDSFEETTRKSGLAWSAGIAFSALSRSPCCSDGEQICCSAVHLGELSAALFWARSSGSFNFSGSLRRSSTTAGIGLKQGRCSTRKKMTTDIVRLSTSNVGRLL